MKTKPSKSAPYSVKCPKCRKPMNYGAAAYCPECEVTYLPDGPHPVVEERGHPHMGRGLQAVQSIRAVAADGTKTSLTMTWEL